MIFENKIKEIEKGCGKSFMWIETLKDKRVCGKFEDLKHSDHIILCPICKSNLKLLKELQKQVQEMIEQNIKQLKDRLNDKGIPEITQANLSGMVIAYEDTIKSLGKLGRLKMLYPFINP